MSAGATQVAQFAQDGVRGFLHTYEGAQHGLVLTHGAGANCNAPLLIAVADAFQAAGLCVLRCDLPFRQERPTGPPFPAKAATDRAGLRTAVGVLRSRLPGHIYLGGHSYGGRQASMLAAEEPGLARALLLLSYPLHPPNKPTLLRTAHFPALSTPAVFVHGSADPFGTIPEMEAAIAMISGPKRLIVVDNAVHDLKRGRFDLAPLVAALVDTPKDMQKSPPAKKRPTGREVT